MSILKDIKSAQLTARKNKDKLKAGVLTSLMSEVAIIGKNQGIDETLDDDAIKVVKKFTKGVNETINLVNDSTKLAELNAELEIYVEFLPKQMSEDELKTAIAQMMKGKEKSPKLMGMLMGTLKKEYDGLYDGSMASKLVKEALV